jgi:translation initiation factor IF-1
MLRSIRWFACVAAALAITLPAVAQVRDVPRDLTLRGKIVKMEAPDRFVVRTADNKEIIFFTNPETRYLIDGRAARYGDLRVGADVNAVYVLRDDRHFVNAVTVGVAADQQTPPAREGTVLRGKIVSADDPAKIIVRTATGEELLLMFGPQTRIVIDGKVSKLKDLRVGAEVNVNYSQRNGQKLVNTITIGAGPVPGVIQGESDEPRRPTSLQGKIVRVESPDHVIVRTAAGREITLIAGPRSRFIVGGRTGRFADLRVGVEVNADFLEQDKRRLVESITIGPTTTVTEPAPAREVMMLEGTVVRVLGEDRVVIKTAQNPEVVVHVVPETTYTFGDRPGRFTDIRTGSEVRIQYNVRDGRNLARTVVGVRKIKN